MRGHLVDQTAILDNLLERSRKSWNRKPPSILAPSNSLRFSILSDSNRFSTTAWYLDYEKDEPPGTSVPFDHELSNSKVYRRVILHRIRRESVQSSYKYLLDETNAASPDLLEGYPMGQVSMIDNAAPSIALDVSDGIKRAASPPKPRVPFADDKRLKQSSSQTPIFENGHPSSAASTAPGNVKNMFGEHILDFEAAEPRAEAPWLCKVLLFGSGAVGKSPLALQVCNGRENSIIKLTLKPKVCLLPFRWWQRV